MVVHDDIIRTKQVLLHTVGMYLIFWQVKLIIYKDKYMAFQKNNIIAFYYNLHHVFCDINLVIIKRGSLQVKTWNVLTNIIKNNKI